MTTGEASVQKTYSITSEHPKVSFVRRASAYGEIVPNGFPSFADLIRSLPKPDKPKDLDNLNSFKHLRPGLDAKTLADPTPTEIINLVSFGSFSQNRFFNTKDKSSYVALRNNCVLKTLEALKCAKTILVHSKLGNGKSIFVSSLSLSASKEGYVCLLWRRAGRKLTQDLEVVAAQPKVLIVFDDYDEAIENIERIGAGVPLAQFVVTVRTGQQEVRYHEIAQRLPQPVRRVNLNTFDKDDRAQLLTILHRAGAQVPELEEVVGSAQEIRDIVVQLYNNSEIREKIGGVVEAVNPALHQIMVLSALIKWAGVETSDDYLQELVGKDIHIEVRKSEGITNDLLDVYDDKIAMRSALLSEFLLQRIFSPKDVLDACYEITTTSTLRRKDRSHRRLAGELMKFSTLQRLIKHRSTFDSDLSRHYIKLSRDLAVNEEPLFWLQYAIFMKTSGDAAKARMFLDAGYERARKIEGFKTFQLDTQALSIYLLQEVQSSNTSVENIDFVLSAIHLVTDMLVDQSNRYYAIEVIGEIPTFIEIRGKALTQPEKVALVFELNRALQALANLTVDDKVFSGSDLICRKMEVALKILTRTY